MLKHVRRSTRARLTTHDPRPPYPRDLAILLASHADVLRGSWLVRALTTLQLLQLLLLLHLLKLLHLLQILQLLHLLHLLQLLYNVFYNSYYAYYTKFREKIVCFIFPSYYLSFILCRKDEADDFPRNFVCINWRQYITSLTPCLKPDKAGFMFDYV